MSELSRKHSVSSGLDGPRSSATARVNVWWPCGYWHAFAKGHTGADSTGQRDLASHVERGMDGCSTRVSPAGRKGRSSGVVLPVPLV